MGTPRNFRSSRLVLALLGGLAILVLLGKSRHSKPHPQDVSGEQVSLENPENGGAEGARFNRKPAFDTWINRTEVIRYKPTEAPGILLGKTPTRELSIPLFDGEEAVASGWFIERRSPEVFSVSGQLDGRESALFSIARSGSAVSGVISSPDVAYQIWGTIGGEFFLAEIDVSAVPGCSGCLTDESDLVADSSSGKEAQTSATKNLDEPAIIDIMVVYTDDVRARYGVERAEADIQATIGLSNQRFRISEADMSLRLTSMREVEYEENGAADADLRALTSRTDQAMDQIHLWREEDGADLVALSVLRMDLYAGIAWLGGAIGDSESRAFSVTAHNYLDWAFTHEIGHNLGCAHDEENAGASGYRRYSFGHRFNGSNGTLYRTQMAYAPGSRLELFSNPEIDSFGSPSGSAEHDNVRTIRETSKNLAAYREALIESSGQLEITDLVFDDPASSFNLPDGIPQPGEILKLGFTLRNSTDVTYSNINLEATEIDPYISILNLPARAGIVEGGASKPLSEVFEIRLFQDCPVGHRVSILIKAETDQGLVTMNTNFVVQSRPVNLIMNDVSITDSSTFPLSGNGNGIMEPGETVRVLISAKNDGTAQMPVSSGSLEFEGGCVEVMSGAQIVLFALNPGSTTNLGIGSILRISPGCTIGERIPWKIDLSGSGGIFELSGNLILGRLALERSETPVRIGSGGIARPGERLRIFPRVANTGDAVTVDLRASIVSLGKGLRTGADIPLEYGSVAPGNMEAEPSFPMILEVTPEAPVFEEVGFTISFESESGQWEIPYSLVVAAPDGAPSTPEFSFSDEGEFIVTVPQTYNGMVYQLEWAEELGSWQNLGSENVGTGHPLVLMPERPESDTSNLAGFIRLKRTAPQSP